MATEAREEAAAETAIDVTHAATGTLQMPTITAAQEETFIVVEAALVLDPDPLTVTDTTDLVADHDAMMMTKLETEAHAVTVLADENEPQAPRASRLHHSLPRMSGTEELSLCSSLLLD